MLSSVILIFSGAEGEPIRNPVPLRSINITDEEKEMQLTQGNSSSMSVNTKLPFCICCYYFNFVF